MGGIHKALSNVRDEAYGDVNVARDREAACAKSDCGKEYVRDRHSRVHYRRPLVCSQGWIAIAVGRSRVAVTILRAQVKHDRSCSGKVEPTGGGHRSDCSEAQRLRAQRLERRSGRPIEDPRRWHEIWRHGSFVTTAALDLTRTACPHCAAAVIDRRAAPFCG
jgi:hypothetical protein